MHFPIPDEILAAYNLHEIAHSGHVYAKIVYSMYGVPQDGLLANKCLHLTKHGYYQVEHTKDIYEHVS